MVIRLAGGVGGDGQSYVGAAEVTLTMPTRGSLCGYAVATHSIGAPGADGHARGTMKARALCLQGKDGARVVFLFADLWGASALLLLAVANDLAAANLGIDVRNLVFATTHTHSGPGGYFGNTLWNHAPVNFLGGFKRKRFARLRAELVACVRAAVEDLQPGSLAVSRTPVWGVGRNRSLLAFSIPPADWARGMDPAGVLPDKPEDQAVDPRLTLVCAKQGESLRAVFGVFGCHATLLGQKQAEIHPDWPGLTCAAVQAALGYQVVVALAQGTGGDVSPLPLEGIRATTQKGAAAYQGLTECETLAAMMAPAMTAAALATAGYQPAFAVSTKSGLWYPAGANTPWGHDWGAQALGGAEDYRSIAWEVDPSTHEPNARQVGKIHPRNLIVAASRKHLNEELSGPAQFPIHQVVVSGHRFVTMPGEPTTLAGNALESVSEGPTTVIGYCGEHCGYITTPDEYAWQQYEGASTLYGRDTLTTLLEAHAQLTSFTADSSWTFDHDPDDAGHDGEDD